MGGRGAFDYCSNFAATRQIKVRRATTSASESRVFQCRTRSNNTHSLKHLARPVRTLVSWRIANRVESYRATIAVLLDRNNLLKCLDQYRIPASPFERKRHPAIQRSREDCGPQHVKYALLKVQHNVRRSIKDLNATAHPSGLCDLSSLNTCAWQELNGKNWSRRRGDIVRPRTLGIRRADSPDASTRADVMAQ